MRRIISIFAVSTLLLIPAIPADANGAGSADPAGDVPVAEADIVSSTSTYTNAYIDTTITLAKGTDPASVYNWQGASEFDIVYDTNNDGTIDYYSAFDWDQSHKSFFGDTYRASDNSYVCPAQAGGYNGINSYLFSTGQNCLGSPASVRVGVEFDWDTNPDDSNADVYSDYIPDAELQAPISRETSTNGYWMVGKDGGVFSFGPDANFYGSTGGMHLNQPVVGMAATPSGDGYWFVASDGGVFAYGDARFYGSTGGTRLNKPIVGMAVTPSGNGYWLVASDGGIFAYGDARFYGSTGSIKLNQPVVGMASTPTGNGYWLVASDGGIFAYGDAKFEGSAGSIKLSQPIVGMASTNTGEGYILTAKDGGIFNYGDGKFAGSPAGSSHQPVTAVLGPNADQGNAGGYILISSDGKHYEYGALQPGYGDLSGHQLNAPIVGAARVG